MNYPLEVYFATYIRVAQLKGWDILAKKIIEFRYKYGVRKAKFNAILLQNMKHCTWQNLLNSLINIAIECKEFDLQITLQEYLEELENERKRSVKNRRKI